MTTRNKIFQPKKLASQFFDTKVTTKNKVPLLESMLYLGEFGVLEGIIAQHAANPYQSIDEMIGDMQLYMLDAYTNLKKADMINLSGMDINYLINQKEKLEKTLGENNVQK